MFACSKKDVPASGGSNDGGNADTDAGVITVTTDTPSITGAIDAGVSSRQPDAGVSPGSLDAAANSDSTETTAPLNPDASVNDASSDTTTNVAVDAAASDDQDGGGSTDALPGEIPAVITTGLECPVDISVDATHAFILNYGLSEGTGSVLRVPLVGGATETLATDQLNANRLLSSATDVYWTTGGLDAQHGSVWMSSKLPSDNLAATAVASNEFSPRTLALNTSGLYWVANGLRSLPAGATSASTVAGDNVADGLTIDDTYAYISPDDGVSQILRVQLTDPTQVLTLAAAETVIGGGGYQRAVDIAVDATHVYWITEGGSNGHNFVARVPKDGSATREILVPDIQQPGGIAVDEQFVYFTLEGGTVSYVAKDGTGLVTTLSTDEAHSGSPRAPITVDATHVYWAYCIPGELRSAPRPL